MIKLGSTAASQEVQLYLKAKQEKQARSHIVPFSSKLLTIASYVHISSCLDLIFLLRERYFTIKGSSFMYKVQLVAGDRASDDPGNLKRHG